MRIGVYSPNWIGDAVMALPFITELGEHFLGCEVVLIGRSWVIPVYSFSISKGQKIELNENDLKSIKGMFTIGKQIRNLGLDRIYLLTDSFRSAWIAWLAGVKVRTGFSGQGRSFLLTESILKSDRKKHRSSRYLELLMSETEPSMPKLEVPYVKIPEELQSLDLSKTIVVFPGSVASSRTIPVDKWIEILSFPIGEGMNILISGGKSDRKSGEALKAYGKGKIYNHAGNTTLRESIELLSTCHGCIATDSGMGHVAAALGIKTLSIFGAGDPDVTSPRGEAVAWFSAGVDCSPCTKNTCINNEEPLICLKSLNASEIWNLFKSL